MPIRAALVLFALGSALATAAAAAPPPAPAAPPVKAAAARDGQHDFDFEIGTWTTHLWRRLHPLTGSATWVEYEGTTVVRKVMDGRANLVELVAEGPAGRFEGISLRLYDPHARQWSLNFANLAGGTLARPAKGGFRNGRGEFYNEDELDGRAILVRFVISDITADSVRFEQAFSADGGQTWEVNWIATDRRTHGTPGRGRSACATNALLPAITDTVPLPSSVAPL